MPDTELPTAVGGVPYFPAGAYIACDPSQILSQAAWKHVVYTMMDRVSSITFRYKGHLVFVWTTKDGDGVFPLYEDKKFYANVAANNCLLCLAPLDLLDTTQDCEDVGVYSARIAIPMITAPGNVRHGAVEVITSREIGDDYDTQPIEYDSAQSIDDYDAQPVDYHDTQPIDYDSPSLTSGSLMRAAPASAAAATYDDTYSLAATAYAPYDGTSLTGATTPLAAYDFSDVDDDHDENCPPLTNIRGD